MLPHTVLFRLAFTVRVAFRTPRVSGTGDAHCISRGFTFLSKCVMQRMRVWSLPALLFLSEPVCRSVGRRPEARAHGGKATRPHPLRHPSRRISLGSRRSSARCARAAPDSPIRVVSACDPTRTDFCEPCTQPCSYQYACFYHPRLWLPSEPCVRAWPHSSVDVHVGASTRRPGN